MRLDDLVQTSRRVAETGGRLAKIELLAALLRRAAGLEPELVRRATMLAGDLGVVARAALTVGAAGLTPFQVQLFRPVQPMLAQAADDVAAALTQLDEAAFEFKLDGARIQVHKA